MNKPFLWAHRGASAVAPENTMASFFAALNAGADGIELDIHLSRDGVPVVIHDLTVDRTTNGRGEVAQLTIRELQSLDAGQWFSPVFAGEQIPALSTVLRRFSGRVKLNLEIKDKPAGLVAIEMLKDYPTADIVVSSFNWNLLLKIRAIAPALPLAVLMESSNWHRALSFAEKVGACAFHPRVDRVNKCLLKTCRNRNLPVYPWTVDDKQLFRRLVRQGISGAFSNDPDNLLQNCCNGQLASVNQA